MTQVERRAKKISANEQQEGRKWESKAKNCKIYDSIAIVVQKTEEKATQEKKRDNLLVLDSNSNKKKGEE